MKGKHLLLPFIVAMAFAGCSENDDPVPNNGENELKDCGYIAVNIAQPESVGGRADATGTDAGTDTDTGTDTGTGTTETGGFDSGSEAENKVNGAAFFVFKKDGTDFKIHTCKYVTTLAEDGGESTSPQTAKIYKAVLLLELNEGEKEFGGEIFCVLNPPTEIKELAEKKDDTLTRKILREKIADYSDHSNGFIMSNSSYNNGEKDICGTEFLQTHLHATEEEANVDPVNVYVERVVAKVNATAQVALTEGKVSSPYEGAPEYSIRITGIELANVANKAGLFKCINTTDGLEGFSTATWPTFTLKEGTTWSFHDVNNKRCYWEYTPSSNTYTNQSYNKIATGEEATPAGTPTVYTPKTTTDKLSFTDRYIQPNTSSSSALEAGTSTTATCILVTAQLGETKDGKFTPANLVWLMGSYFSNEGAKKLLCDYLKNESYVIKTTNNDGSTGYRYITDTDLTWKQGQITLDGSIETTVAVAGLEEHQAIAQINLTAGEVIKATKNTDGTYTEIKKTDTDKSSYSKYDANKDLTEKKFRAEVFKDGLCYYFAPIDQAPVMGTNELGSNSFYGVVRNHIYNLTLSGISGIGTAVFDPTKPIIPTKPKHDNFRYLSAKVNVLKWKIVSQSVKFEGN